MNRLTSSLVRYALERTYDRYHVRRATSLLATLERQAGTPLSRGVRREADRYAASVLGSSRFAPWLLVYSIVAGEFREGWIPDNFYGRVVCPNVNHGLRFVADLKTFSNVVFRSNSFPDVAYLIDGTYFDRDRRRIAPERAAQIVFSESDEVIVKSDGSRQGVGVTRLSRDRFDPTETARAYPQSVLQRLISQHAFFERFRPGSATTVRITTVRTPSGTEARAAYVRFARGEGAFVRSADSVRVALDVTSGRMSSVGYTTEWSRVDRHPDSGVEFGGGAVPSYEEAVGTCVSLHAGLPHAGVIGWDLMVDAEGLVWVLEWNAKHNDIKFSEAATGPCFADLGWEKLRPVAESWLI
jgi:hypothetical protein